jgi:hypothetical protein
MTPAELIALALLDSGVIGQGQTASAEDANNAFIRLNMMMAQWRRKRWLVYHEVDVPLTSTGAQSYTVGTGGDFDVARPDRLEAAFVRQLIPSGQNQVDYPLEILQAREDYNLIALKTMGTLPQVIFYDSAYPLGVVYPWPVPQASIYQIHLTLKADLPQFTSLAQTINLPEEYRAALHYNLCARLRPAYQMPPDPSIVGLARDALNVIRSANTQIPRLRMPASLRRNGGRYNILNDQP